jgi:dienelactone hydrolase
MGDPIQPRAVCHAFAAGYGKKVRRHLLTLTATAVALLAASGPASATTLPDAFTGPCPAYGDMQVCSGTVPSFDRSKLDVDLTLPSGGGAQHPLIVMLHGFGNNKHEWESLSDEGDGADKFHWNSHWFAEHGYYVLTYTARGFRDDGTTGAYEPPTPADRSGSVDVPNGTIKVKSRNFEIRDTQWLAALVAATFPDVQRDAIAVTGGSYGGGESWVQASQAQWTFPHSLDPTLPVLDLQVAVPKYPWTDLAYSLAPNGHGGGPTRNDIYESSQASPENDTGGGSPATGNPLGVPKASYIAGLSELGTQQGVFDPQIDLWNSHITGTGDPYLDEDPVLQDAARGLTEERSAYYQDEGWVPQVAGREVAVFSISGWTDDLFEAVESFRQFKYLKRLDPLWPVAVRVADIGHSRAQNKPATWRRLNAQAFGFLQSQIGGSHRQQTVVASEPTICGSEPDQQNVDAASQLTATTPEGLAAGTLTVTYAGGDHVLANPLGLLDPNGPATDPIIGDVANPTPDCRTSTQPATGGYTGVSDPLTRATTYVGLGEVDVGYAMTPALGQAQLDARLWDVPPTGPAYLVTRGTFRIDSLNGYDPGAGALRLPLYGNHWELAPGHRLRLDLTQVDAPALRPNNQPSSIEYGTPKLVLPIRQARTDALAGTP